MVTAFYAALASDPTLSILAFALPLAGVALSWWSFRFAEEGAVPDNPWHIRKVVFGDEIPLKLGIRGRARACAALTFNVGAILLASAVPMGSASAHMHDPVNLLALAAYLMLGGCAIYALRSLTGIWRWRKQDAFNLYFSKEMWPLYEEDCTRRLYFKLNPMPIWTLLDRKWYEKRKQPDIQDVFRLCSKDASAPIV